MCHTLCACRNCSFYTMNYEVNGFQFICVLGEHEQQVVEMRRLDWSEASCHNWTRSVDYVIATGTVTKRKLRTSWISIVVLMSWSS